MESLILLSAVFQQNALLLFGVLLLLGLMAGHLVTKSRWIPRLTGYLVVGFLLGEGGIGLLSGDTLAVVNIFADIAVALVVYQLGRYVDIDWLLRERWLLATVATSSLLCVICVGGVLSWLGISFAVAMLGGIIASATAPAVVMVVVRDLKAEGQVTRRLAAMTALNNLLAIVLICVLLPLIVHDEQTSTLTMIGQAAYSLAGSVLLAWLTYWLMMPLARWVGRRGSRQFVLVVAVILLSIGMAHALHLPVMLTMLVFAIMSKNLDRQYDLMELEFGIAKELFVVMLFVAVGASIRLSDLATVGIPVLMLIAMRFVAMAGGIVAYAGRARLTGRQAALLALGTIPMTEGGIGLLHTIRMVYPDVITGQDIVPLVAGALIVLELLGPVVTQYALIASGENGREA